MLCLPEKYIQKDLARLPTGKTIEREGLPLQDKSM